MTKLKNMIVNAYNYLYVAALEAFYKWGDFLIFFAMAVLTLIVFVGMLT